MKDGKGKSKICLVEVMPITRVSGQRILSYFSTTRLSVGSIVRIPIRKQSVSAVVVSVNDAREAKVDIKSRNFTLRKISEKDVTGTYMPEGLMRAAVTAARYYASHPGNILYNIIPKFVLDDPTLLGHKTKSPKRSEDSLHIEPLVIQMDREERFIQYRSIIRQAFARKTSVLLICPSLEEARWAFDLLSKGISDYTFLLASDSTKRAREAWAKAQNTTHPILFITTAIGITFDRKDLGTIILEGESSQAYRTFSRPFISIRKFLEDLTRESKRDFVLGDSVLSIPTLHKARGGQYGEFSPIKWHLTAPHASLVDSKKPTFEIFSPELKELIKKALSEKAGIFLFGVRKGLSPTTVCGDCGAIFSCKSCQAPLVLHRKPGSRSQSGTDNVYVCHRCGEKQSAKATCRECNSWKLTPLGIGTDLIASEVQKKFPGTPITLLDRDHVTTALQARKAVAHFREKGGVLVGTELAFFYLDSVPYAGLVSADALFSIPDFGTEERIFHIVSRLREISTQESIIQTRNIGREILTWATRGNILDFYKKEIAERESLFYPPFSTFIKITGQDIEEVHKQFSPWGAHKIKDSVIIRQKREDWPDEDLVRELTLLSPRFSIKVDPDSIL